MSTISHSAQSVFIHIPKCAGSSMESMKWNEGGGHKTIHDYLSESGMQLASYFKWCFVRNPWERIASAYEDCPEVFETITSFKQFVSILYKNKTLLNQPNLSFSALPTIADLPVQRVHFFSMLSLLTFQNEVVIDFVGRFENLYTDWDKVCHRLGKTDELIHVNARKDKPDRRHTFWQELYDKELSEMVEEIYHPDIEYFGYDKPTFKPV